MARGDERALGTLYDRHARALFGLALTIAGQPADAEEVVADALAQAWRQAERFDPARGGPFTWLVTLTRSRALDHVRARRRRHGTIDRASAADVTGFAVPLASPGPAPDAAAEAGDLRTRVTAALATLPDPQRRVIELAYFGGLSQSEIAEQLDTPLGTVKTRMRAAMEKLRDALGAYIGAR